MLHLKIPTSKFCVDYGGVLVPREKNEKKNVSPP